MTDGSLALGWAVGGVALFLEFVLSFVRNKFLRRSGAVAVLLSAVFSAAFLFAVDPAVTTSLVAFVVLYRAINAFRVLAWRMKDEQLLKVTSRTSRFLVFYQCITVLLWAMGRQLEISLQDWLYGIMAGALLISLALLFVTRGNLQKTRIRPSDKYTPDMDLPTVSVCVPARNETEDLPACLASILGSDYPKLEVLVLDDCSHDKTSEIIKGFARDGVRFLAGEPPRKNWLAKNQAYQMLAEAATGDILLFCGVDVRFEPHAIRSLVGTMIARKKDMISVLPKATQVDENASLVQPMRYWWELVLPRRRLNRPPVLSTLWMISRQALFGLGDFRAVNNSVVPEAYFARELTRSDGYSFMRASGRLMVSTTKQFDEQWQTALRTRYPQLRKRPENVLLVTLGELLVFGLPLGLFVAGFITPLGPLWWLAGLSAICSGLIHYQIVEAWGVKDKELMVAVMPVALLLDILLLQLSMWRYEFSRIEWKDRNICIPVMHTIPRLPKA